MPQRAVKGAAQHAGAGTALFYARPALQGLRVGASGACGRASGHGVSGACGTAARPGGCCQDTFRRRAVTGA